MTTIDEILTRWKHANPLACHRLGIHDFDGQLPDFSVLHLHKRGQEIRVDLKHLQSYYNDDKLNDFEVGIIESALKKELFLIEVQKEFTKSPLPWISPLTNIEVSYIPREFAPFDERLKSVIRIEEQIPDYIHQMFEVLDDELARPKIEVSLSFLVGVIAFLKDTLISYVTKTDDEALIFQWADVNLEAVAALERCKDRLENEYLPQATYDFALGRDKFIELLKYTEGVEISLNHLLEIGEQDLKRNRDMLLHYADKYSGVTELMDMLYSDIPSPDHLLDEIRETLHRAKQFTIDADLLDLPTDTICEVIPTPSFARAFVFAAMRTPGPFESQDANQSYYWVTLPDPKWSEERRKKFMRLYIRPFIEMVTIHEAFPGHFVQLLFNQQSKSEISKLMARSTSMIEGWGHYAEEMIYEQGYVPITRDLLHVGQLMAALHRNLRYVCAIKLHCFGMTVEEAVKEFMNRGFLPEPNARVEANRGTVDPMYLNYTLGKLMIKKLKADYQAERGEDYSIKEFHNLMLSYGSPPITLLRKLILEHDDGELL